MKAKYHTRKKFSNQQKKLVNLAANYIIDWTKKELNKYKNKPVVIQVGDYGFLVGKFKITGVTKNCWSVNDNDGQLVHYFISKTNAILFCMCETTQDFDSARELLELDSRIGKLENDLEQYQFGITTSKDKFKKDLFLNRYLDTRYQYKAQNDLLKKTLKLAKYTKFRNYYYEINRNEH
jgi:hypothetical protein